MSTLTEVEVETVLLEQLTALSYTCIDDAISSPDGPALAREAYSDMFLPGRLRAAFAWLNPSVPEDARDDALRKLLSVDRPSLTADPESFMLWRTTDGTDVSPICPN